MAKCEEELSQKLTAAQEMSTIRESELCSVLGILIRAVEERSVDNDETEQILSQLSELESTPAPVVRQLAQSLGNLLREATESEHAGERKEQELLVRIKEAETHTAQLQSTVSRLSQESELTQLSTSNREQALLEKLSEIQSRTTAEIEHYKENIQKVQEDNEQKIQALSSQLQAVGTQKREAEARANDSEEYWQLQLKNLQEEWESDMKQQRLTFENDLSEQRAEYETRLNSVLDEQEGLRLGQKAILEDKLVDLQETLNHKQAEFKRMLAENEAEFRQRQATQDAEMERKLANLEQCLQKEVESQREIRSQMNEDSTKIQELEVSI